MRNETDSETTDTAFAATGRPANGIALIGAIGIFLGGVGAIMAGVPAFAAWLNQLS